MTPLKGLLLHSQSGTGDRDLAEGEEGRQRALQSSWRTRFLCWGRCWVRRCWGELCAMSGLVSLCSSVPSGGTGSDGIGTRLLICSYSRSEMQGMSGIAPLEQGLSARIHIPPS